MCLLISNLRVRNDCFFSFLTFGLEMKYMNLLGAWPRAVVAIHPPQICWLASWLDGHKWPSNPEPNQIRTEHKYRGGCAPIFFGWVLGSWPRMLPLNQEPNQNRTRTEPRKSRSNDEGGAFLTRSPRLGRHYNTRAGSAQTPRQSKSAWGN